MQKPPKEKSLYIHTLIFSKSNGIDNIYAYFPDSKILLGYIQYSFLQEAFYKWIYGKDRMVTKIPPEPVEIIIKKGLDDGLINKEIAKLMLSHYSRVERMWDLPKERVVPELIKFSREFNRTWFGNHRNFIYMKIFKDSIEFGEFVIESILITNSEKDFEHKIGVPIGEWKEICKSATSSKIMGERFQQIIQKNLSEII
ncbi:hypothetical protein H9661_11225 [Clostridium sp. Sa3CVN1]|uniref:Uncharacterized protein n=2 Tax=Clostridiaceae TaxID=31979 RepID=A0ABR8PUS5_9CLOT|nr:hypothetical protein [Clostridium cibarium]MBD7911930.1 hypothetical protein [Clostridium cibarium]